MIFLIANTSFVQEVRESVSSGDAIPIEVVLRATPIRFDPQSSPSNFINFLTWFV